MKSHIVNRVNDDNHTINLFSQDELFSLAAFLARVPNISRNYYQVLEINTVEGVVCYTYTLMNSN